MWNGELGTDEKFYYRDIKKIIPRLKSVPHKTYSKSVKSLIKPEIDEDVHAIMSDIVQYIGENLKVKKQYEFPKQSAFYKPKELDEEKEYDIYYSGSGSSAPLWVTELTDYGLFEKKVNLSYSKLSEAGFVRYGRESNKEEMIYFIILVLSLEYPKINPRIEDGIHKENFDKIAKGLEHFYIKTGKPFQEFCRETVSDEHKYGILLSEKYLPNLTASLIPRGTNDLGDIKCPYCGASLNEAAILIQNDFSAIWELKGKALDKKLIEHEGEAKKTGKKIRPYKWSTLLNMFYSSRSLENEKGLKIFRNNHELQKIWGIPRKTWSDKWNLLASLDENL